MKFSYKKRKEIIPPSNFAYDRKFGAWISNFDGKLLVKYEGFPNVATKKLDQETGEDNKGQ